MFKHLTEWQKLPLQTMWGNYNKYNANSTRNVAYYKTRVLSLGREGNTEKKKKKKKIGY